MTTMAHAGRPHPIRLLDDSWDQRFTGGLLLQVRDGIEHHQAYDRADGSLVSLKVVRSDHPMHGAGRAALLNEYRLLSLLAHPAIPRPLDLVVDAAGSVCLVLTQEAGFGSLEESAALSGDALGVVELIDELLCVLEYVHARGVVHAGIDATAVRVSSQRLAGGTRIQVVDFHNATYFSPPPLVARSATGFFTPPDARSRGQIGPEVDLFAVGALAIYLLAAQVGCLGQLPLSPSETLGTLRERLDARLASILDQLVSPESALRPASAWAVRTQLADAGLTTADVAEIAARPSDKCGLVLHSGIAPFLTAALDLHGRRGASLFLLAGEAGAGKSSVGPVLRVECVTQGYRYVDCTEADPETRVSRLTREAAALCGARVGGRHQEDLARRENGGSLLRDVPGADTCHGPGIVLFVDDIDRLSVGEVCQLLEPLWLHDDEDCPLTIVATCSNAPSFLLQAGFRGARPSSVNVRSIGGFSPADVGLLVSDITCSRVDPDLSTWLTSQTAGCPAFVGELVRFMASHGHLRRSATGTATLCNDSADLSLPPSLSSAFAQRVAGLPSEERALAELAALGPGVTQAVMARVSGKQLSEVSEIVDTLAAKGIVRGASHGDDVAIAHGLMREAILGAIAPGERRELHSSVARAWSDSSTAFGTESKRDQVLAWHLWHSDQPALSMPHALTAARHLASEGRVTEALAYLRMGDAVLADRTRNPSVTAELARVAGELYWDLGRGTLSAQAFRTAIEATELAHKSEGADSIELHWMLGRACLRSGDADGAYRALLRTAEFAQVRRDDIWLARANAALAAVHQMRGEFIQTNDKADECLNLLRGSSRDDLMVAGCMAKGNALVSLCDWRTAKQWYERAIESAGCVADAPAARGATCNLGLAHLNLGEWEAAEQCFEEALAPARTQGCAYSMALALNNWGILSTRRGAFDEASSRLWEATKWFEECGDNWGLALAYSNIGELEHLRGNDHAAQDFFVRSEELMSKAGSVDDLPELYRRRGESLIALGEAGEASNVLERGRSMASDMGNALEAANCARVLAQLASRRGSYPAALALATEAVDSLRSLGARYELARSLATVGEILALDGQHDRASASFDEARTIFTELGARRDARAAQEAMAAASGDASPAVQHLPDERVRLSALYRSSTSLAAAGSISALSGEVADIMAANVPADVAAVVLLHPDGDVGTTVSSICEHGGDAPAIGSLVSVLLASPHGALPQAQVFGPGDAPPTLAPLLTARGLRRILVAPMVSAKRRIGALYLDYRQRDGRFSEQDVRFVEALASQAATAAENLQLRTELVDEIESLRWDVDGRYSFANIIGRSLEMQRLFSLLQKVTRSSVTVLVEGESGTGKELVARALHFNGPRKKERFVAQNCAALPEQLLESELFGHVRGAFTGALRDKPGLFEAASGGTFFLDEIADMPASLQVKLLRVLQDGEIRRVGATDPINVDVRIVAATNKSLEQEVKAGRFREDLYYRLNVVRVVMPPLRDRRDDIPLLAQHFLNRFAGGPDESPRGFTDHAMALLVNYDWPGNVRELENEIERAVALAKPGTPIGASALSERIRSVQVAIRPLRPGSELSLKDMVEDVERRVILQVLNECDWNKSRAAESLGLSRQGLLKKIARFGLAQAEE